MNPNSTYVMIAIVCGKGMIEVECEDVCTEKSMKGERQANQILILMYTDL